MANSDVRHPTEKWEKGEKKKGKGGGGGSRGGRKMGIRELYRSSYGHTTCRARTFTEILITVTDTGNNRMKIDFLFR